MANEDIIAFDGTNFSLYFDGSDVGLAGLRLDAFAIVGANEVLMSFTVAGSVPGISETVDDSDIVKFTGTLGPETAGTFEMYFDGSDVGLTRSGEDVDAIERLPDGTLLLSTSGSFSANGLSGLDEDIIAFTPISLAEDTAGSFELYFDGSDVSLGSSREDVDGLAVDSEGQIYLSTIGNFSVSALSGTSEDVSVFTPSSLGSDTVGAYDSTLFFDGSLYGLGSNNLHAIDLPLDLP